MDNIRKFYGDKFIENQKKQRLKMTELSGVPYFLTGEDEGAQLFQLEFDKYLELAYRHNIVDQILKRRLSSQNWGTFLQARNELMGAYFVENYLKHRISFYPRGEKQSIGDFLIEYSEYRSIFVEVKSPVRKIQNPFWSGYDSTAIKRNIIYARKQMTKDKENLILFAGELRVPISHEPPILNSLFGEPIISFPVGKDEHSGETRWSRDLSGLFQPKVNTRISAIATLRDYISYPPEKILYSFKVYHNPYSKEHISSDICNGYPQFIPNNVSKVMEWINK